MAENTSVSLRKNIIYSIYIRNFTPEGTFRAAEKQLKRIKELGADIIWLMPIHPIGKAGKKGSLGCPYAISDYRAVNPSYGSMDDFIHFTDMCHALSMKCIIDVVYNHTSPDSVLAKEHPEFFYRMPDGKFGNKDGLWSDVIDLDYSVPQLWDYQIETLKMWAKTADGFRCDVASMVPLEFWKTAVKEVAKVNPDCFWLAETVHSEHIFHARESGFEVFTDYDGYQAFDAEYEYDIRTVFDGYFAGKLPLSAYIDALCRQESFYPENYIKLRCLENHDMPRIASLVKSREELEAWTAFLFFEKGITMLYMGQEYLCNTVPSLFEYDKITCDAQSDISGYISRLAEIKKKYIPADGWFSAKACDDTRIVCAKYSGSGKDVYGIFPLGGNPGEVETGLADGDYNNLIDKAPVSVKNGRLYCKGKPIIIAK